jgi:hypothetical protein
MVRTQHFDAITVLLITVIAMLLAIAAVGWLH